MSKQSFVNEQYELYKAKNALYGDSFTKSIDKFGATAYAVRASDKVERIKQLTSNKDFSKELEIVNDEKIEDTVRDLFNYTCMYIKYRTDRDLKEIMKAIINAPNMIFSYLCLPYGEFKSPILNNKNPEDIELFNKIKQILNSLIDN